MYKILYKIISATVPLARDGVWFGLQWSFLFFFLLDSLPESIRSVSDHLSESLTDSLQGVPAGGCETERAKPHAIAPISRLYLGIPSRNLINNDVSSKNL